MIDRIKNKEINNNSKMMIWKISRSGFPKREIANKRFMMLKSKKLKKNIPNQLMVDCEAKSI